MKEPEDVRQHRRKTYFSDRELEIARKVEEELGLTPSELMRELYMSNIRSLELQLLNDRERRA